MHLTTYEDLTCKIHGRTSTIPLSIDHFWFGYNVWRLMTVVIYGAFLPS